MFSMVVLLFTAVLGPFYELSTIPILTCLLIGIAFAVSGAGSRSWHASANRRARGAVRARRAGDAGGARRQISCTGAA